MQREREEERSGNGNSHTWTDDAGQEEGNSDGQYELETEGEGKDRFQSAGGGRGKGKGREYVASKPSTSTADEIWTAENIDLLQETGMLLKKLLGATRLPLHAILKKLDLALTYSRENSWNLFKQYIKEAKGTVTSGKSPPAPYAASVCS